jgi:DNA-directed RNA polymerase subunit RPC12/RpoP
MEPIKVCPECGGELFFYQVPTDYINARIDKETGKICWGEGDYEFIDEYIKCSACGWEDDKVYPGGKQVPGTDPAEFIEVVYKEEEEE